MVKREGAPQTWKPPGMRTCTPILQVPGSLVGELRLVMALNCLSTNNLAGNNSVNL